MLKSVNHGKNIFTYLIHCYLTLEEILNIKQFVESHNTKYETVCMYISRHRDLFEGHIKNIGKFKHLDNEAIKLLEKQYPPNIRCESIENKEFKEKYFESLEKINYLQSQLLQAQKQIGEFRSNQLLIENQKLQIKHSEDLINKQRDDIEYLKRQCDELQARNLFDFLFRRGKKTRTPNGNHSVL